MSPLHLFIFRTVVALYCIYSIIHIFATDGLNLLKYYTVWNWIFLTIYFILITILSFLNLTKIKKLHAATTIATTSKLITTSTNGQTNTLETGVPDKDNTDNTDNTTSININNNTEKIGQTRIVNEGKAKEPEKEKEKHLKLRLVIIILFLFECVNVLIVDVTTWLVLFPLTPQKYWTDYWVNYFSFVMHGLNLILIYFDLCMNNVLLNNIIFAFPSVCIGWIYLIFQLCWVAVSGSVCKIIYININTFYDVLYYIIYNI